MDSFIPREVTRGMRDPKVDHGFNRWTLHAHLERVCGDSAGARRRARRRCAYDSGVRDTIRNSTGYSEEKAAGCAHWLRAFVKVGRIAARSARFAKHGMAQASFRGYADYMQTKEFDAALQRLSNWRARSGLP